MPVCKDPREELGAGWLLTSDNLKVAHSMFMNLPRNAFPNLMAAGMLTLSSLPNASEAQVTQPSWVAATLAGLIRNCSIPASQLSLRWNEVASTLRLEVSPTLNETQQRCLVQGFKGSTVKIEGLPSVPSHFSSPNK
jgi:hypothetical protein